MKGNRITAHRFRTHVADERAAKRHPSLGQPFLRFLCCKGFMGCLIGGYPLGSRKGTPISCLGLQTCLLKIGTEFCTCPIQKLPFSGWESSLEVKRGNRGTPGHPVFQESHGRSILLSTWVQACRPLSPKRGWLKNGISVKATPRNNAGTQKYQHQAIISTSFSFSHFALGFERVASPW